MLPLPRNLHFEVHKVLCLLRASLGQANQNFFLSSLPSHPQTMSFVTRQKRLEQWTATATFATARMSIFTATRSMETVLTSDSRSQSVHDLCWKPASWFSCLLLKKALQTAVRQFHPVEQWCDFQSRNFHKVLPATKSAIEPHVQKSPFTEPVTKSELFNDHHRVQSAVPASKSAFRSKTAPIPCACQEKSTLDHENTRYPWRLPRK